MEEIFDSKYFTVEFDKESESAVLTWKEYDEVDNFRTPLMKAADIVRRHKGEVLIIDRTFTPNVSDKDQLWVKKIFVKALKQSGCQTVIVVSAEDYDLNKYPFDIVSKKFELKIVKSRKEAINLVAPEASMTVEQALEYMGLPKDANSYAIDEKFWQMSKNIRSKGGDDYEAKLDELSEIYDIASGRKGSRDKALAARNRKKKYFGKTSDEWRTHMSYSWLKYLAIILVVVVLGNLVYHMFIKPKIDCGIVSIGHFSSEDEYYEDLLLKKMGFKNAYVNSCDVVVPNDEGASAAAYSEQSADAMLTSEPNLMITDTKTTIYYFTCCKDMTDTYNMLKDVLPEASFNKLKPVYASEREYYYLIQKQEIEAGLYEQSDAESLAAYSSDPIMIGIEVDDPDYMSAMGYTSFWKDDSVRLVFSIYFESRSVQDSQNILTRIFKETL